MSAHGDPPEGFEEVTEYVEDNLSFATSHYNDSYLQRRIKSRMRRTGTDGYPDYLEHLRADESEGDKLLEALSINVTGFFRNPEVWDGVRDVLRTLTDRESTVRVWSAACADGREPYSLAMLALDDPDIDASKLSIRGTDINDRALEHAREGVYESNHTSDLDEQLAYLDHYPSYVTKEGEEFTVSAAVKDLVSFDTHDIIRDAVTSRFELVLCRNLFIYIDAEFKVPVIETVRDALVDDGYLVVGKAETIPREASSGFEVVDSKKRIYQHV